MSQLDMNVIHPPVGLPGHGASRDQQQGWRQSMESEGWRSILDTMRNFPCVSSSSSPNGGSADMPVAPGTPVAQANQEYAPSKAGHDTHYSRGFAAETVWGTAPHVAMPPDRFAYAPPVAELTLEENPAEQEGLRLVKDFRAQTEEVPVAPRKVLVLPSAEDGVEVWIRDARVTGAQMQMLLADVRRHIQAQGSEISRISVNGRQVDSDRPERVEFEQTKKQAKGD